MIKILIFYTLVIVCSRSKKQASSKKFKEVKDMIFRNTLRSFSTGNACDQNNTSLSHKSLRPNEHEVVELMNMDVRSKHVKLINNGTNCYANSLFQCLYNIESVRNYFTSKENRNNEYFDIVHYFIRKMMDEESFDTSSILTYSINKFDIEDFKINECFCPMQFLEILITKLIFDDKDDEGFLYSQNKIEDIEANDIYKLFLFEDNLTQKEDEDFKYDPKDSFRYKFCIVPVLEDNTSFQDSLDLYFKNSINCIHLPQIVIINFQNHDLSTTKYYKIIENIDIMGIKYVFRSCIVFEKINDLPHYFSLIYEEDKFVVLDCLRSHLVYDADFDFEIRDVYSFFYERVQ